MPTQSRRSTQVSRKPLTPPTFSSLQNLDFSLKIGVAFKTSVDTLVLIDVIMSITHIFVQPSCVSAEAVQNLLAIALVTSMMKTIQLYKVSGIHS